VHTQAEHPEEAAHDDRGNRAHVIPDWQIQFDTDMETYKIEKNLCSGI
jgi:hypothetical protein